VEFKLHYTVRTSSTKQCDSGVFDSMPVSVSTLSRNLNVGLVCLAVSTGIYILEADIVKVMSASLQLGHSVLTFWSCRRRLCGATGLDCGDRSITGFVGCVDPEMIRCRLAQLTYFVSLTSALIYRLEAAHSKTLHAVCHQGILNK